jgi:hypothetical protein
MTAQLAGTSSHIQSIHIAHPTSYQPNAESSQGSITCARKQGYDREPATPATGLDRIPQANVRRVAISLAESAIPIYTCLRTQTRLRRGHCTEVRWDPLTGRPRMTASRDAPAIELATALRQLAIDGLPLRPGGMVTITVLRSS